MDMDVEAENLIDGGSPSDAAAPIDLVADADAAPSADEAANLPLDNQSDADQDMFAVEINDDSREVAPVSARVPPTPAELRRLASNAYDDQGGGEIVDMALLVSNTPERRSRRNLQLALRTLAGNMNGIDYLAEDDPDYVPPIQTPIRKRRRYFHCIPISVFVL